MTSRDNSVSKTASYELHNQDSFLRSGISSASPRPE